MQERTLYLSSLIAAILGLVLLFLVAEDFAPQRLEQANLGKVEQEVVVRGVVRSIRAQPKATFLQIEGERVEQTDIILFNAEETFLKPGDYVEVQGMVEEYKGKQEVVGSKVTVK